MKLNSIFLLSAISCIAYFSLEEGGATSQPSPQFNCDSQQQACGGYAQQRNAHEGRKDLYLSSSSDKARQQRLVKWGVLPLGNLSEASSDPWPQPVLRKQMITHEGAKEWFSLYDNIRDAVLVALAGQKGVDGMNALSIRYGLEYGAAIFKYGKLFGVTSPFQGQPSSVPQPDEKLPISFDAAQQVRLEGFIHTHGDFTHEDDPPAGPHWTRKYNAGSPSVSDFAFSHSDFVNAQSEILKGQTWYVGTGSGLIMENGPFGTHYVAYISSSSASFNRKIEKKAIVRLDPPSESIQVGQGYIPPFGYVNQYVAGKLERFSLYPTIDLAALAFLQKQNDKSKEDDLVRYGKLFSIERSSLSPNKRMYANRGLVYGFTTPLVRQHITTQQEARDTYELLHALPIPPQATERGVAQTNGAYLPDLSATTSTARQIGDREDENAGKDFYPLNEFWFKAGQFYKSYNPSAEKYVASYFVGPSGIVWKTFNNNPERKSHDFFMTSTVPSGYPTIESFPAYYLLGRADKGGGQIERETDADSVPSTAFVQLKVQ